MRIQCVVAVLAACLLASGCQSRTHIEPVLQKTTAARFGEELAPIRLDRVSFSLTRGQVIGSYRDASGCGAAKKIYWSSGQLKVQDEDLNDVFFTALKRANYNVVGDPQQLFGDYAADVPDPEYLVGGIVSAVNMDICDEYNSWYDRYLNRQNGIAAMDVTWQVFSTLERKVVYEAKTRGSGGLEAGVPDGEIAILESAFAAAAENLAADQGFHDLLAGDGKSIAAQAPAGGPAIAIPSASPFTGGIAGNIRRIERSVVTVVTGGGHGSGFFVAPKLVLTNHHVAGGSKRVKLQFVDGKEVYATVLRSHPDRDVALLEVEAGSYEALPIRGMRVSITEEVYAVGSPLDESLVGTVTRGIVSQIKPDERALEYIQADVSIQHGSSGGPLLDRDGNVVGISNAALMDQANSSMGINFFIPIGDALKKLNIVLK